jgi:outer membrane biosynthesis protein TonB
MPVIVNRPAYRQPWLWGLLLALAAVAAVAVVIFATPRPASQNTTVLMPPATTSQPAPRVVEEPVPVPGPTKVKKVTKVVAKPVPVPGPTRTKVVARPVPVPVPVPVTKENPANPPAPSGSADNATAPASSPTEANPSAGALYQDTGLPRQIHFDDRAWKAQGLATGSETDLKLVPEEDTVNGQAVYHKDGENPPYDRIYLQAQSDQDRYVIYAPAP